MFGLSITFTLGDLREYRVDGILPYFQIRNRMSEPQRYDTTLLSYGHRLSDITSAIASASLSIASNARGKGLKRIIL